MWKELGHSGEMICCFSYNIPYICYLVCFYLDIYGRFAVIWDEMGRIMPDMGIPVFPLFRV